MSVAQIEGSFELDCNSHHHNEGRKRVQLSSFHGAICWLSAAILQCTTHPPARGLTLVKMYSRSSFDVHPVMGLLGARKWESITTFTLTCR